MQIDVTLEVFKELTARLRYDGHSYDDVIRELLGLDSPLEIEAAEHTFLTDNHFAKALYRTSGTFFSRGLALPNGTQLRARYKSSEFLAKIKNGTWLDADGEEHSSPSAAARAITGNNVNGLRFWECLLPGDSAWRKLDSLPQAKQ